MFYLVNILKNKFNKPCPRRPSDGGLVSIRKIIWVLEYRDKKNPNIEFSYQDIDEKLLSSYILPLIDYINHRYDCSDFRVLQLIKLKLVGQDVLDKYPNINKLVTETLLSFKFWVLEPGNDSMCYYSENHQITYIACEYLLGKMYPNSVFTIDNKTGLDHKLAALERFNYWIELRNKYSYSEFYSSNYTPITLTALAVLYQYSDDKDIKNKCKKEVDTILRFFASTSFEDTFINASGRDYSRNVMNCSYNEPHSRTIIDLIWGNGEFSLYNYNSTESLFVSCYLKNEEFRLSEDIKKIYYEDETITKRKFSLNTSDYSREGLNNNSTKSIMMRLGMGAITNPEVINLNIKMMNEHKQLYKNNFLSWLRLYYSPLLYKLGLMPKLSKVMNFYNNRMAIEESNVYTYRNKYFKLSTNQAYQMNSLGAQKNTIVATLPRGITLFTMHPINENNDPNFNYNSTPSYFSCYNFAPYAVQDKNVAMLIYNIPSRPHSYLYDNKIIKGHKILKYTHTFFPTELFDEYSVEGRYAFVRVNNSYLAIIAKNDLYLKPNSEYVMKTLQGMLKDINKSFDLVQPGLNTYWIYELSSSDKETYLDFKNRIKSNEVNFDKLSLEYKSNHTYRINDIKAFYVDNKNINLKYEYDVK